MLGTHSRYSRLKDGTLAHLRDIRPSDDGLLRDGFSRLSAASRYARFFTPMRELTPEMVRYLTEVDGTKHVAVVAVTAEGNSPLGVARFVRDEADPASAEFAITVVDEAQGQGLGLELLTLLEDEAKELGITAFTANIHSGNRKIRGLLRKVGAKWVGSDGSVALYRYLLGP